MNHQYNLYNYEAKFKTYLIAVKISPVSIKNYLSDFRYFAGWMISQAVDDNQDLAVIFTSNLIAKYKTYLITNNLPAKTINRRLSTVRKFCSFCISQGWINTNPAKQVGNLSKDSLHADDSTASLLSQFETDLIKSGFDKKTVSNHLSNIKELIFSSTTL